MIFEFFCVVKILFDGACPDSRPDFILPDDFVPDFDKIKHLHDWSSHSDAFLLTVEDLIK